MAPPDPEQLDDRLPKRVIKRYSNRKLYDTEGSRYVTLLQVAELVRAGEDVQIIDNATKEDKTETTLALIISEELKAKPRGIPVSTLKALIRNRGEKLLTTLRDGPIGRLMPREGEELDAEGNWHLTSVSEEGAVASAEDTLAPPAPRVKQTPEDSEDSAGLKSPEISGKGAAVPSDVRTNPTYKDGLMTEIEALRETLNRMHDRLVALEQRLPPAKGED